MSRHRADPDDDEAQAPPTSDTGPLQFGHGDWPPLRPAVPAGTGQRPLRQNGTQERVPETEAPRPHDESAARTPPTVAEPVVQHTQDLQVQQRILAQQQPTWAGLGDRTPPAPVDAAPVEVPPIGVQPVEMQPVEMQPVEVPPIGVPPVDQGLPDADVDDLLVDDLAVEEPVDELGLLPPEPVAEKGHRRGKRDSRPRRRGRRPLAVLLSLGVIAALVAGIFYGGRAVIDLISTDPAADYSGQGGGATEIEVPAGASTAEIAEILQASDVVASAQAFLDAASGNAEVLTIQPGVYQMREQMSGEAAVSMILDPASRLFERATIPEGLTVARTLEVLAEQTEIPLEDYQAAEAATDQLGLPAWSNGQLEGFLYPATYDIGPDSTAVEVLADMVARFNQIAVETGLEAGAAGVGLTPYQLLTLASMVQSEVTVEAERPVVARVIYNRLGQGIQLGIDATLAYELGINGNELTTEALNIDSPYNTRIRFGLPPTPISNPGQPSIVGALLPAAGDWIYYVLQNSEGEHFFTANYEEFLAAKAQCEAAGLGCG